MSDTPNHHFSNGETWRRGLLILLFAVLYGVAELVLWAVVLFQFGSHLITGQANGRLLTFSRGLTAYIYQILQYITYRSEMMPYPFATWPTEGPCEGAESPAKAEEEENEASPPPPGEEIPSAQPRRDDEGETESGV